MIEEFQKKLIWKSRRGLLELDLMLSNFVKNEIYFKLSDEELYILDEMLDMNDYDLLYQINGINTNHKFYKLIEKIRLFINKSII